MSTTRPNECVQDAVVQRLWDAAGDDNWQPVLDALCNGLRSSCATLFLHDHGTGRSRMLAARGLDAGMQEQYEAHFGGINPWVDRQRYMPVGSVIKSEDLVPLRDLLRSEYYADWLQPQRLIHALGSTICRDGETVVKLGILRGKQAGPISDDELALIQRLLPHVAGAWRVRQRCADLGCLHQGLERALDTSWRPCVLVDAEAVITYFNAAAERLLALGDGLQIDVTGRFQAHRLRDATGVRRDISSLLNTRRISTNPQLLRVDRPSGRIGYVLEITSIERTVTSSHSHTPVALVSISDPDQRWQGTEEEAIARFGLQFDLTAAEARLAWRVANSRTLTQAASELGIQESTARFVSKRLFEKTNTRGQAELVASLLACQSSTVV